MPKYTVKIPNTYLDVYEEVEADNSTQAKEMVLTGEFNPSYTTETMADLEDVSVEEER